MRRFIRRALGLALATASLLAGPVSAAARPAPTVIDQFSFSYLPPGLGAPSDFSYDFAGVDFTARVWESRTSDGWQVDLDIAVMRGARLSSGRALHDWFIGYERRDPAPRYHRVLVHGRPGWLCRDQLFWFVRPGVAVSAHLDGQRWPRRQVVRTARSAHELSRRDRGRASAGFTFGCPQGRPSSTGGRFDQRCVPTPSHGVALTQ